MTHRGFSIIPTLAAVLVTVLTLSLGSWQLRRADEKTQLAQVRDSAASAAPITIGPQIAKAQLLDNKRVVATGVFELERSVFIDNRTHNGRAGFHVVTPLRIDGMDGGKSSGNSSSTSSSTSDGTITRIAVLRGWVPRNIQDRNQLPSLKPIDGSVTITGLAQISLGKAFDLTQLKSIDPAQMIVPNSSQRIWQQFAVEPYAKWLGGPSPLQPVLIRQLVNIDDGLIRDWPQPANDVNKHLGYAFQWFGLSALTVFLWGFYAWRGRKASSKIKRETD